MDLVPAEDGLGNQASPTLPEHVKNYLIDIDGTVGEDIPNETARENGHRRGLPRCH